LIEKIDEVMKILKNENDCLRGELMMIKGKLEIDEKKYSSYIRELEE
jgi:hypothetical protein